MRISFVHTKGGVGKTTSSILLATAAIRRGIDVEFFDADPQASASRWAEVARNREDPLEFEVMPASAKKLRAHPASTGWQIVDTPPGNAAEIQAAIDTADLVIVPTHPSPIDLDRVWPTLETINHRMVGVLLIGVQERRRLYQDTREIFESQGVSTFYNTVPEREDIKAMFGTNPRNIYSFDEICTEILEIEEMN
ncbi:CobQ/CobB/MinD/ParA nucleotide binding domain protein [Corynebacterium efficiens YS-314]|uniref:Putative partitioning protein parA n=1 Tax=Corynebacterium efficiens (strain DSM 44549 / YS-314 / AJ 12310 / JCM 11189 / NBRC 100395) TaxID=196164 RepID=Q8FLI4_COREF|nr:ParA family protein [Corynebacterium efficiens]EEW48382.1 CobQ/CobB/MinD/ParA nucleotide binding domain protein [Corynebacterium efficiens YS-314]BAC19771.1 putative partitioning protein parA [Corynebacterium efficiens YS-314]